MKRPKLKGAFKLVEEMGELTQVLMKLAGQHDPDADLIDLLHEELGDVLAAAQYLYQTNPRTVDVRRLTTRIEEKVEKFRAGDLRGLRR